MSGNQHDPSEPISIEKNYEVRHWARIFSCTEDELREAVAKVGTDPEAVRRHLGQARLWTASNVGPLDQVDDKTFFSASRRNPRLAGYLQRLGARH